MTSEARGEPAVADDELSVPGDSEQVTSRAEDAVGDEDTEEQKDAVEDQQQLSSPAEDDARLEGDDATTPVPSPPGSLLGAESPPEGARQGQAVAEAKHSEEETRSESSSSTLRGDTEEDKKKSTSKRTATTPKRPAASSIGKGAQQLSRKSLLAPTRANRTPMKRAPIAARKSSSPGPDSRKAAPMMRIHQQPSHHQESFGEGIKTGPSGSDNDSDSEISDAEHFLAKGAFLLTPSHELSLEKASAICEKMNFSAPFSLTKTATGILFKFARPEDYQATFKKGFHKVTGARFYKKIPIPCRPQKTFTVFVLEVPEEVPEEDIRHALYKFHSVVEVVRLVGTGGPQQLTLQKDSSQSGSSAPPKVEKAVGSTVSGSTVELGTAGPPPLIRVTLANLDEYNLLLQNGLDFYGATFFPTEAASPSGLVRLPGAPGRKAGGNRILDVVTASGQRVRDLLPVFDSTGFSKIPPPAMKTIKPRSA